MVKINFKKPTKKEVIRGLGIIILTIPLTLLILFAIIGSINNVQDHFYQKRFDAEAPKIISINVVDVEESVNRDYTNEQLCNACKGIVIALDGTVYRGFSPNCYDNFDLEVNVQVKNYNDPIFCGVVGDNLNSGWYGEIYNGLNKIERIGRDDFRKDTVLRIHCQARYYDKEEDRSTYQTSDSKAIKYTVPARLCN